ncbi:MAG: metal-dependent hydrolase [Candidatus Aenigmarchaeota archaeon]|nr:metal-dependent hydrolase [Candidatus Aenigmarchaeota archaeon]
MDLISHALFALILNQRFDLWVIVGSLLPDMDKLYTYPKKRFFRSESHTFIGEIPFASMFVFALSFLSPYFGPYLFSMAFGYMSHILLDFLAGETKPFRPFLKDKVDFNLGMKGKLALGAAIWLIGLNLYGGEIWISGRRLLG